MLLASRKVVSETESHVQLYPASDVQKMFTILNLPVPDFILRAAQGEVCGHVTVTCYPYVAIVSILCMTCCSTMHSAECRLHLIGRTVPPHTTQIQLHTALLRASVYARGEALLLCVRTVPRSEATCCTTCIGIRKSYTPHMTSHLTVT